MANELNDVERFFNRTQVTPAEAPAIAGIKPVYIVADTQRAVNNDSIYITQNDNVKVVIKVQQGGKDVPLPEENTYTLTSMRKDGVSVVSPPGELTGPNEISFNLGTQAVELFGKVQSAVQINSPTGRVSTLSFVMNVAKDVAANPVPSTNEKTLIEMVLYEGPAVIENAKVQADRAELAAGTIEQSIEQVAELTTTGEALLNNVRTATDEARTVISETATVRDSTEQLRAGMQGELTLVKTQLADTSKQIERLGNAEAPLTIYTYEGYNQAVHPDVVYFPNGWNGYKYWMCYTPYPWTNDFYENPSIAVSNDGIEWLTPTGLVNPLDSVTKEENDDHGIHLSDGILVYRSDNNTLECWWRWTKESTREEKYFRRVSSNGVSWSEKELVYQRNDIIVSPSVIFENGKYRMWAVTSDSNYQIVYTETTTPNVVTSWSTERIAPMQFSEGTRQGRIWHIHIFKEGDKYHCVWNEKTGSIYWAISTDNGMNFKEAKEILKPYKSEGRWDNNHLYRASLVKVGSLYRLFYSALGSSPGRWYIGLTEGESLQSLKGSPNITNYGIKTIPRVAGSNANYQSIETEAITIRVPQGEKQSWLRFIDTNRTGAGVKVGDKTGYLKVVTDNGENLGNLHLNSLQVTNLYPNSDSGGVNANGLFRVINSGTKAPVFKLLHSGNAGAGFVLDGANTLKMVADNETDPGHMKITTLILSGGEAKVSTGALRLNSALNKFQGLAGGNWYNLNTFRPNVPETANSPGTTGDYSANENYLYVCYQASKWIRIGKDEW